MIYLVVKATLLCFISAVAMANQCYMIDSSSFESAALSEGCFCGTDSECFDCENAINQYYTNRSENQEQRLASACVDGE